MASQPSASPSKRRVPETLTVALAPGVSDRSRRPSPVVPAAVANITLTGPTARSIGVPVTYTVTATDAFGKRGHQQQ